MFLLNLEFLTLVIAVVANLFLVVVVLMFGPRDKTRYLFSGFCVAQAVWLTTNYVTFLQRDIIGFLFWSRVIMFFAIIHAFLFFCFVFYLLKKEGVGLGRKVIAMVISLVVMLIVASTTYIFEGGVQEHGRMILIPGPLMPLFGLFVLSYIFGGFYQVIKKYRKSIGIERIQWKYIGIGLLITFVLVLVFSFLSVVVLHEVETVRFGHLYTLPFVIFTAYAMIKHHLMNIKVILAELSVVLLNLILFIKLISTANPNEFILNAILFVGSVIVGVIFVKSILKEIKVKEQLAEANIKLQKLDRAKTEFISITSHQLRTPLSGLKGYLSMLMQGDFGELDKEKGKVIGDLFRNTGRLIRLVNIFLNVSRIEMGRLIIDKSPSSLDKLTESAINELRPEIEKKGLEIKFNNLVKKVPELQLDKDKINDVLLNLIENSMKYTEKGGIEINLEQENEELIFSVKDTGIGFSPCDARKFFHKFSRGSVGQKGIAGSGLGLYIVRKIIEAHSGKTWCESAGSGQGSIFGFRLPIVK